MTASIAGCTAKRAGLPGVRVKASVWSLSLAGPAEMPVAHAAEYATESSSMAMLGPAVNVGASLTGLMVMVNVRGRLVSTPPFRGPSAPGHLPDAGHAG